VDTFQLSTPTAAQVIILVIVIFIIGIGLFIAARRTGGGRARKKGAAAAGTGWHSFNQIVKLRGLNKDEATLLRGLVVANKLSKPSLVFSSVNILDSCIQRQVRKLSLQEIRGESKEDLINRYYRLRNKVVRNRDVRGLSTTRAIPLGARMRTEVQNYGQYSVQVNQNEDEFLGISIPVLPPGKFVPWNKKRVKCLYWKEEDASYIFESKVIDVIVTDEVQSICLKHVDQITRSQKRLYPRKSVRLPVYFSRARVVEEGGKKKAKVDRRDTHWGTIIDISVGGLSIETAVPFNRNSFIKVEFELREDYKMGALGKVKRIEKNAARNTWIMHIQFAKIEKKDKNEIFAVLYNYQTV
jgi:c-di-GMP-binding flagellar brake protein YcgR